MFVGAACAQTTGTLRGTVKDPSGAVVPGAHLTVTLEGSKLPRTTNSNASGDYEFAVLPVGRYSLEAEAAGFKKFIQKDIEITLGHVVVIDPGLQVGAMTQEVTTVAAAPLVETTSTQLGAVVNSRSAVELPLNTRDTYQLLQLQPGVSSQVGSDLFYGSDQPGVVSVNGGRGRSNNFMVNGGDANDEFVDLPGVQPSPDTIQEFRVLTNTFDAEFGRNSGSVVNVVTKSGTNDLHGDLYEFLRNKVLNARGFFDTTKPDFKQNQFGGTLGGPIKKDRTFFFASYEGLRNRQGTPGPTVPVPTAAETMGDFSQGGQAAPFSGNLTSDTVATELNNRPGCAAALGAPIPLPSTMGGSIPYATLFPNNYIPVKCFDPTAYDLMNQFVPPANLPGSLYQAVPTAMKYNDQITGKIDHQISDKQQLGGYYYFIDEFYTQPFSFFQAAGANVPGFGGVYNNRYQQFSLTHTWTVNSATVNEARFTTFREAQGTFNHPQHTNLVQQSCVTVPASQCFTGTDPTTGQPIGITPGLGAQHEGVPFIFVSGGFAIGNNFEGELPQIGNTFQWTDNLSKVAGKHTLKFGADVRRQRFDQLLYYNVSGYFSYLGGGPNDVGYSDLYPNYLLGLPDTYSQGSAQFEDDRTTSLYLYAQDSWKVRRDVTLNYGLRWELNTPWFDTGNRLQTFRLGQATTTYPCQLSTASAQSLGVGTGPTDCNPGGPGESVFPLGLVVPGDQGIPRGLTQTYYNSFAPRIGMAWSPGGSGKTSLRAGWGMFYNPIEQLVMEQFSAEPPFGGSSSLTETLFNTPFLGQSGSVSPNPFSGIKNPQPGQPVDWSLFRPILLYGEFQPNLRSQYSEQYNFTLQREVKPNLVAQISYVGSQGHRLLASHDLNYGNAQTCLDLLAISNYYATSNPALSSSLSCGPFFADSSYSVPAGAIPAGMTLHLPYGSVPSVTGPNNPAITLVGLRPHSSPLCEPTTGAGCPPDGVPVFSSVFAEDTMANSAYNSLQASLEKRFSNGLQFLAAYTWSKSLDDASSFENELNPLCFRCSRALSLFNAAQRFVFSYYWEFPVPKHPGLAGALIDGWAVSGIATLQSGFPIRILSSADIELENSFFFEPVGEPNLVASFKTQDPRKAGCAFGTGPTAGAGAPPCQVVTNQFFDPNAFAQPALGTIGSSPRAICCGPTINDLDFAFLKSADIGEHKQIEFRAELYNAFNHAQFYVPDGNISDGSTFGEISKARDPRLIQFALKFVF